MCIRDRYISVELKKIDAHIDEFFISPYHPMYPDKFKDLMHLRKPNTGMLEIAESKWSIKRKGSFLIGDKKTDVDCAANFGIRGHLFDSGNLLDFIKRCENI